MKNVCKIKKNILDNIVLNGQCSTILHGLEKFNLVEKMNNNKLNISEELFNILVECLSDNRIIEILNNTHELYNIGIGISDNSRIGYITEDRLERFDDVWDDSERDRLAYIGKVGKTLNRAFNIKLTTNEVEKIQSRLTQEYHFEILSSSDISEYYHEDNYSDRNTDTLENSCMRYSECEYFFGVYEHYANMLVLYENEDSNKIIGRAILWNTYCEELKDDIQWIDRIYGTNQTVEAFKKYAKDNNLLWKTEQSYNNSILTNGIKEFDYTLSLNICDSLEFPYMDTMKYFDYKNEVLYNKYKSDRIKLDDTEGNRGEYCESCCEYHRGESVSISDYEYVCEECIDGYYTEINGKYYPNDKVYICNECGEACLNDETRYIENEQIDVCDNCLLAKFTYVDSECDYYRDEQTIICSECDEVVLIENTKNGICEACFDDE